MHLTKGFLIILFSINSVNSIAQEGPTSTNIDSITKEELKLKGWAFCKCMLTNYPQDSLIINDGSLGGYFETGSYPKIAYERIDSLLKVFNKKKYGSKFNKSLVLMKCLDFYESAELRKVIKSISRK